MSPESANSHAERGKTAPDCHRLEWLVMCLASGFLVGCSNSLSTSSHRLPPPPTEEVRSRLGTIIVESAGTGSKAEFAKPYTEGQAAAAGAAAAVADCLGGGSVVGVLLIPVGAGVGGVVGASKGMPKAEVEAAEQTLLAVFNQMDFQRAVRDKVLRIGSRDTRHPFVTRAGISRKSGGGPEATSVLQVDVLGAGLAGGSERNAPLAMFLRVHVRLLGPGDRALLYEHEWVHTSGAYTFKQWAADGGRLFRGHLSEASSAVAQSIIEEIFLSWR